MTLPVAWSPRRTRLKANANPADGTIRVNAGPLDSATKPFLAKLGTELVTVESQVSDTLTLAAPLAHVHPAGAYLVEATIRVTMGDADITAVAQGLRHKEASPEGEVEATWTIYTRNPSLYDFSQDAEPVPFLLWSNESGAFTPFFGGYIGRMTDSQSPNGFHALAMVGRGAYVTASWRGYDESNVWPADTPGHRIVEDAFGVFVPYVSPSHEHILDGGLQIGQQLEGIGKTPRELVDFVVARGDLLGPLDWYVRTDPDGGMKLWLLLRSRQPTVEIPISSLRAPVAMVKDYEYRRNMVIVKWRDGVVPAEPDGPSGAVRWRFFDYATRIDNEPLARQVAKMLLANLNTLDAISDGQIVIEHPKPVYVGGSPFPLHRLRAGWMASITGWTGGFALGLQQIKSLEADHRDHTVSLGLGKVIEDDVSLAEQFFGKETKILGTPASGLVPQNIAPPEGVPQAVMSAAVAAGPSGIVNREQLGVDFDVQQSTYNIDGAGSVVTEGRKSPDDTIEVGGRLLGFKLRGNDGADPPGPGSIDVKVYLGHAGDGGAPTTVVTTASISADIEGRKDLAEPPGTSDVIVTVTPEDYLVYEVQPGVDGITNCAITRLIQRTEGSSRATSGGGPTITGQTATRDATTGVVTFTVVTDRPCYVQIEYGKDSTYGNKSQKSEIIKTTTNIGVVLATPFHWHAIATDKDGHVAVGADVTG